jgi:hypothetical protein
MLPILSILRGIPACWAVAFLVVADPSAQLLAAPAEGKPTVETPLVVECQSDLKPGSYLLKGESDQHRLATVFVDAGKTYLATVLDHVPSSGGVTLDIAKSPVPDSPGKGVELIPDGRRIGFKIDGQLVTEYIPDDVPKPYFFPLVGPSGSKMTRAFPMKTVEGEKNDHIHHRSLWFTHGSVNKVDFWSEVPGHGKIIETSRPTVVSGRALGRLRTTDDWLAADGKKVCEDERVVTIFATQKTRILDFDITLKASEGPVTFGDTKEGMFGLRVATSMDVTSKKGGKIVNSEGINDTKAWGKAASWVDYTGPVDGKTVGISILNHPSSFRYPTTWHVRDYGLFAANPFGYHDFGQKTSGEYVLPKGDSIQFRYRVILHDGDTASADLPTAFRAYEARPKVTVE